jgi:suppressor for copper-sensitivity B
MLTKRAQISGASRLLGVLCAALALALLVLGPTRAATGASDWFATDHGRVRLIAGGVAEDGATLRLGLAFEMIPGWKIYWRSPGDAGYPPTLDWTGSENLAEATLDWPAPKRFTLFGIDTIGYEKAVVLPIEARLQRAGAPTQLRLALSYLTCSEICVPYEATLTLDLADPAAADLALRDLIATWRRAVPDTSGAGTLRIEGLTLRPGAKPRLELRIAAAAPLGTTDVFVEGPAGIGFGRPTQRGPTTLAVPVEGARDAVAALTGGALTVTVVGEGRATERRLAVAAGPATADIDGLLPVLALAVLGGFILNFMPCVLPVLSLKLLGLASHGGRARRAVRLGFLATAAGVLFSFAALAAAMTLLKAAGLAVGWGVQFQQPLFLVAMIALVTLFACNLWGLFEIVLPGWAGGVGTKGPGTGLAGDFLAGAFATLLATPCSAPFLGTAVGFALAGGGFEIWTVFLALGIGLALPYLVVAAIPGLARLLPRPGHWMVTLRRALALALAATALWLLSVLAVQIGGAAALVVGGLMAILAVLLIGLRRSGTRPAAALATVAAALLVALVTPIVAPARSDAATGAWRDFDPNAIAGAVGAGKTVFVDVTADWCLTCQVNKKLVLQSDAVRALLARPDVVAMRADWTRPDATIAAYLRGFGRYGIPFDAVYGPARPGGEALSEILSEGAVVAAFRRAGRVGG